MVHSALGLNPPGLVQQPQLNFYKVRPAELGVFAFPAGGNPTRTRHGGSKTYRISAMTYRELNTMKVLDQPGRDWIFRRSHTRSAGIAATPEGGSGALFNVEAGTSAAMRVGSRGGL